MVAPVKQLPLLLLLQGSRHVAAATAEGDGIISAYAELPSGSTSFYAMHYSGQGCNNSSSPTSFVSLRGFLPGNSSSYHPAKDANGTCAVSSVCSVLFDSEDDSRCPVEGSFTRGEVSEEDGHVYFEYKETITDFTRCKYSTWYPGCYFEYYSLGALKTNPDLLANSDPADLDAMQDFIYYVYYEDDKCTEPASIWSSMAGEAVTVDIVSNYSEYSCAVRSACVIDPNSALCEALRDGPDHTATFVSITELDESTGEQVVADCDTSNFEEGQDDCSVISPRDCIASSLIPGCHLRFFSGSTLSKYPNILVGDMTGLPYGGILEGTSTQHLVDVISGAAGDNNIISAFANLPSGSTSFYATHYSGQGCNNSTSPSSFISMEGFLPGFSKTHHPDPDANDTCTESSVCSVLFNSVDDSRCPQRGSFAGKVESDGDVYLGWGDNFYDNTQCQPQSWFPGCSAYDYYSLGALKSNPNLLANSDPADLEAMKDFIYYVYYEDDKCTDPASIWSSMAGEAVTVDIVSNYTEYSCAVRSACVIDPNSALCEALRDGPDHTATFEFITGLDESTGEQLAAACHADESGQPKDCIFVSPRKCLPSGIIPGCHLRFFSGSTLSKYPRILVGDMTDLPDAGFVEGDSSQKPVDGTSGAGKVSLVFGFWALYICWFVLF